MVSIGNFLDCVWFCFLCICIVDLIYQLTNLLVTVLVFFCLTVFIISLANSDCENSSELVCSLAGAFFAARCLHDILSTVSEHWRQIYIWFVDFIKLYSWSYYTTFVYIFVYKRYLIVKSTLQSYVEVSSLRISFYVNFSWRLFSHV